MPKPKRSQVLNHKGGLSNPGSTGAYPSTIPIDYTIVPIIQESIQDDESEQALDLSVRREPTIDDFGTRQQSNAGRVFSGLPLTVGRSAFQGYSGTGIPPPELPLPSINFCPSRSTDRYTGKTYSEVASWQYSNLPFTITSGTKNEIPPRYQRQFLRDTGMNVDGKPIKKRPSQSEDPAKLTPILKKSNNKRSSFMGNSELVPSSSKKLASDQNVTKRGILKPAIKLRKCSDSIDIPRNDGQSKNNIVKKKLTWFDEVYASSIAKDEPFAQKSEPNKGKVTCQIQQENFLNKAGPSGLQNSAMQGDYLENISGASTDTDISFITRGKEFDIYNFLKVEYGKKIYSSQGNSRKEEADILSAYTVISHIDKTNPKNKLNLGKALPENKYVSDSSYKHLNIMNNSDMDVYKSTPNQKKGRKIQFQTNKLTGDVSITKSTDLDKSIRSKDSNQKENGKKIEFCKWSRIANEENTFDFTAANNANNTLGSKGAIPKIKYQTPEKNTNTFKHMGKGKSNIFPIPSNSQKNCVNGNAACKSDSFDKKNILINRETVLEKTSTINIDQLKYGNIKNVEIIAVPFRNGSALNCESVNRDSFFLSDSINPKKTLNGGPEKSNDDCNFEKESDLEIYPVTSQNKEIVNVNDSATFALIPRKGQHKGKTPLKYAVSHYEYLKTVNDIDVYLRVNDNKKTEDHTKINSDSVNLNDISITKCAVPDEEGGNTFNNEVVPSKVTDKNANSKLNEKAVYINKYSNGVNKPALADEGPLYNEVEFKIKNEMLDDHLATNNNASGNISTNSGVLHSNKSDKYSNGTTNGLYKHALKKRHFFANNKNNQHCDTEVSVSNETNYVESSTSSPELQNYASVSGADNQIEPVNTQDPVEDRYRGIVFPKVSTLPGSAWPIFKNTKFAEAAPKQEKTGESTDTASEYEFSLSDLDSDDDETDITLVPTKVTTNACVSSESTPEDDMEMIPFNDTELNGVIESTEVANTVPPLQPLWLLDILAHDPQVEDFIAGTPYTNNGQDGGSSYEYYRLTNFQLAHLRSITDDGLWTAYVLDQVMLDVAGVPEAMPERKDELDAFSRELVIEALRRDYNVQDVETLRLCVINYLKKYPDMKLTLLERLLKDRKKKN